MPVPPPQRGGKTSGRAAASTSPQRFNPGAAPSCLQLHGLNHKPAEGAAIVTKRGAECRGGAMMACIGWTWEGGGFASIRCRWERWRMAGWLAAGLRAPDVSPCPSLLTYPPYINWLVGSVPRIPRRGFPTRIYFLASVALNDRSEYAEGRTPEGRKRQLMGCTR